MNCSTPALPVLHYFLEFAQGWLLSKTKQKISSVWKDWKNWNSLFTWENPNPLPCCWKHDYQPYSGISLAWLSVRGEVLRVSLISIRQSSLLTERVPIVATSLVPQGSCFIVFAFRGEREGGRGGCGVRGPCVNGHAQTLLSLAPPTCGSTLPSTLQLLYSILRSFHSWLFLE